MFGCFRRRVTRNYVFGDVTGKEYGARLPLEDYLNYWETLQVLLDLCLFLKFWTTSLLPKMGQ